MVELYRKYRPTLLKQIVGQEDAVQTLKEMLENKRLPHALLLSGPSGVGKTTLARILQTKLNCSDKDFTEINCAENCGVDKIRTLCSQSNVLPMNEGGTRIWYLDESHMISGGGQQASLGMLENAPDHAYYILATTEPQKLINTIHTRCTELKLRKLTPTELTSLVKSIMEKEGIELSSPVIAELVEVADGSARKALVLLDQVHGLDDDESKLDAIRKQDGKRQAYGLLKMLAFGPVPKWADVSKLLKGIEEEPETIRRQMLGLAAKVMLDRANVANRIVNIINQFDCNFFDSGKAGLYRACFACSKEK